MLQTEISPVKFLFVAAVLAFVCFVVFDGTVTAPKMIFV